jgi:hypothetical protein
VERAAPASPVTAGFVRSLAGLVTLALVVTEVVVLASVHASEIAYIFALTGVVASLVIASPLKLGRVRAVAVALLIAAAAALLAAGWGFPLDASRTERAFADAHPNLSPPIRCRAGQQKLGGLFEKVYVCFFKGASSGFPVAVNDSRIVREWP